MKEMFHGELSEIARWCRGIAGGVLILALAGCTTSQWVDGSRKEVVFESAATAMRPILKVEGYPNEKPEVVVLLLKELDAPVELQLERYELIHTVWGTSIGNVLGGWWHVALSPALLVGSTLTGHLGYGVTYMVNAFKAAMGFNLPKGQKLGSGYHIPDRKGEVQIERRPIGTATRQIPWAKGDLLISGVGFSPVRLKANDQGHIRFSLTQFDPELPITNEDFERLLSGLEMRQNTIPDLGLPSYLTDGSQELVFTLSTKIADTSKQEAIAISASTIRGWWTNARRMWVGQGCKALFRELKQGASETVEAMYRLKLGPPSDFDQGGGTVSE